MNPIALGMLLLGALLLGSGLFLVTRGRKVIGIAVAILGFSVFLFPLFITYFLFR